jgi:peptidoglycan/xylan/chitin deacetylase (PgdA/CDA1 family)
MATKTKKLHRLWVILIIFFVCPSCKQDVPHGLLPEGYIALTFDDASVDNWYSHLGLLDSLNIKATFYVCKYHTLTVEQKQKLHAIERRGHQIAYHTTYHGDLRRTLERRGMEYVLSEEIWKDLRLMRADGFETKDFAFPYGSHAVELDNEFLKIFNSVRALANRNNYTKCLALQSCRKQTFFAPDIDDNNGSWPNDDTLQRIIEMAADKSACAVFTAHEIDNADYQWSVSATRLRFIAGLAQLHHLRFITISEISN